MLRRSLITLAAVLVCLPLAAQDMTLDQVLAKHYEAVGGLDAWKSVNSARMTGTMHLGSLGESAFTVTFMRPNKARLEYMMQGITGIQAYDGETAWMLMPLLGQTDAEVLDDDQAKDIIERADFDGVLVDWQDKGHQLTLVGREDVEGTDAYRIDAVLATGDTRTFFLDSESLMTIRQQGSTEVAGAPVEFEIVFSEHKDVGGIKVPHLIEVRAQGSPQGQVFTVKDVVLNPKVDESIFTMPEPTPDSGDEG